MLLVGGVEITGEEWTRLALVLLFFGLYLAVMTLAGVSASSLTYRSATSFALLLTFWVVTVVVFPRISLIVADVIRPAPSTHEFQAKQKGMQREALLKRRARLREWEQANGPNDWWKTAAGRVVHELAYQQIRDEAQADGRIVRDRLEAEFEKQSQNRLSLAVILARISPAFALKNATIRLTGTGIARQQRFFQEFIRYRRGQYFEWAREREDKDSLRRSDPDTYGEFTWHIDGLPRFTYTERWPDADLQYAMLDRCVLALWGLVFFSGAYAAVLRYDLR